MPGTVARGMGCGSITSPVIEAALSPVPSGSFPMDVAHVFDGSVITGYLRLSRCGSPHEDFR
jgi:hypothetical protein